MKEPNKEVSKIAEAIGERFQEETKYFRGEMSNRFLDWTRKPPLYKEYSQKKKIALADVRSVPAMPFDETVRTRKSIRRFSQDPLTVQQLSYLLWASTGIQRKVNGYEFRTAPSAGALYPIETYIISANVEDLEEGVYHYHIREHALEELKRGDYRREMAAAALGQEMCLECAVIFTWTALFIRSKWKYNQRAYRYIYLDAGHIAENLILASVALGLGSCPIGAFFDDEVNALLGVDGVEESAIYLCCVGTLQ